MSKGEGACETNRNGEADAESPWESPTFSPSVSFPLFGFPMHLSELSTRALQLRDRYAALARSRSGRPWTREEIMQGFVVDVGDLMKLVMAKSGARHVDGVDAKLRHELADCLWSVLVLAQLYDIDLEAAFAEMTASLEAKLAAVPAGDRPEA